MRDRSPGPPGIASGPPLDSVESRHRIGGLVLNEGGEAAGPGVLVVARDEESPWNRLSESTTGPDGRFLLVVEMPSPGVHPVAPDAFGTGAGGRDLTLRIQAESSPGGLQSAPVRIPFPTQEAPSTGDVLLRLRRTGRIHGTVVSEAGRPVPSARVLVHSYPRSGAGWTVADGSSHIFECAAGEDGRFEAAVRPGKALLWGRPPDGPFGRSAEVLVGESGVTECGELRAGGSKSRRLVIRITGEDGTPIKGAGVRFDPEFASLRWIPGSGGSASVHARSDETGVIRTWLPEADGPIVFAVGAAGFEVVSVVIPGQGSLDDSLDVKLRKRPLLRVLLVKPDGGRADPPVDLDISPCNERGSDRLALRWRSVDGHANEVADPALQRETPFHPVALLTPALAMEWGSGRRSAEGEYAIWVPCDGDWELRASIPGWEERRKDVEVRGGGAADPVVIEIPGGRRVFLRVLPPAEIPAGRRAITDREMGEMRIWPLEPDQAAPSYPVDEESATDIARRGQRISVLARTKDGRSALWIRSGVSRLAAGSLDVPWAGALPTMSLGPEEDATVSLMLPTASAETCDCLVRLRAGDRPLAAGGVPILSVRAGKPERSADGTTRFRNRWEPTGADGVARFRLDPGTYRFMVHPGVSSSTEETVELMPGRDTLVELHLK
jgi:hypothetical protein